MGTSGLANILVDDGLISSLDRATIRKTSGNCAGAFAKGILALGVLGEEELATKLVASTGFRRATDEELNDADPSTWSSLDRKLMGRLEALPLKVKGRSLFVALVDPLDKATLRQLEFFTGYKIKPVIATLTEIRRVLNQLLTDFKAVESPLENFLANHVSAAALRKNLNISSKAQHSADEDDEELNGEVIDVSTASDSEDLDLSSLQKIDGDSPEAETDDFSELEMEDENAGSEATLPTTNDEEMAASQPAEEMPLEEAPLEVSEEIPLEDAPLEAAQEPGVELSSEEAAPLEDTLTMEDVNQAVGETAEEDPFASLDTDDSTDASEPALATEEIAAENLSASDTEIEQLDAVDAVAISSEPEFAMDNPAGESSPAPTSAPLHITSASAQKQSLNIAKLNQAVLRLTLADNSTDATKVLISAIADVFVNGAILKGTGSEFSGVASWEQNAGEKVKFDFLQTAKYCTDGMQAYLKSLTPEQWQVSADITPPYSEWHTDKLWVSTLPTQSDALLCFVLKAKDDVSPDEAYLGALADLVKTWRF